MHKRRNPLARWGAAAMISASLILGTTGCGDPAVASKSVGDDADVAAGDEAFVASAEAEVQVDQAAEADGDGEGAAPQSGYQAHPYLDVEIRSEVALERYAYTTDPGNRACDNSLDRPAFTIAAGGRSNFCLVPGTRDGNARINVTYKIVGDPEGRTVWMFAIAPYIGYNRVLCELRKADMDTTDKTAPYECEVGFRGDQHSYLPEPGILLTKKK